MCGRIVCYLHQDDIISKCFFMKKGIKHYPKYRDNSNGNKFIQSYNISPSQLTPILFCESSNNLEVPFIYNRIIQPMKWGLVPSWYKKGSRDFKFKTHNAKIETIFEKTIYKSALLKGNRCVVIINGFYEWHNKKKNNQYFIKSKSGSVLYLCGIFNSVDIDDKKSFSYSILTEQSQGIIADIHHRSPTLLHDEKEIDLWLDSKNVTSNTAVEYFRNRSWVDDDLEFYPVSTLVNNSSNNDPKCISKLDDLRISPKKTSLTTWLNWEPLNKKSKLEEN